jgi:outer membrane lipoprotein-sorting protein
MRFRSRLAGIALGCLASASAGAIETAEEIQACVRKNVEAKSAVQTVVLDAKDRVGAINRLDAKIYYKKDDQGAMRVLLEIEAPQDLREAAILLVELPSGQDIFMYVPELRRTRRLHGRMVTDTMFGTDFSYEDFRRMQAVGSDLPGERLADAEIQGRPVFVVASKLPESAESIYQRLVAYVDQATCVPLKVEFFQKGDAPRKVLEADPAQVVEQKGRQVARKLVLRDLQAGTETAITISDLKVDVEIPEKLFQERTLDQRR